MGKVLRGATVLGLVVVAAASCVRFGSPGDVHRDVRAITGGAIRRSSG